VYVIPPYKGKERERKACLPHSHSLYLPTSFINTTRRVLSHNLRVLRDAYQASLRGEGGREGGRARQRSLLDARFVLTFSSAQVRRKEGGREGGREGGGERGREAARSFFLFPRLLRFPSLLIFHTFLPPSLPPSLPPFLSSA